MRLNNCQVLNGSNSQTVNGTQIDSNQLEIMSFHMVQGDATAAGIFKIQASNDIAQVGPTPFTVTNWVDIPNATSTITAGILQALITLPQVAYRFVRAVYTPTAAGVQTIMPVADVAGSLNSKYFLLQDEASSNLYYVWINVDSGGVDPMVAGRTGVPIAITAGDTAATIGGLMATAIAALNGGASFSTSGTTTVTVTNLVAGPFVPATDVNTGFAFAVTAGGHTTVIVNIDALGA